MQTEQEFLAQEELQEQLTDICDQIARGERVSEEGLNLLRMACGISGKSQRDRWKDLQREFPEMACAAE